MAEEDKWMLEVDVEEDTAEEQQYWLYAVEAARQAGSHALDASNGATSELSAIVDQKAYQHLPSHNPLPLEMPREDEPPNNLSPMPAGPPANPRPVLAATAKTRPLVPTGPKKKRARTRQRADPPGAPQPSVGRTTRPHPRGRTNVCSAEAQARDSCNLLQPFQSRIRNDRQLVRRAFARPPRLQASWCSERGRQVTEEIQAYRYATESMRQSEFKRLEGTEWLSDATINMFLKAYVSDKVDRVHCYSTHFFTHLFQECDPETLIINFDAVANYSTRQLGGLSADGHYVLDDLYIPTHVGENHWIVLRANFTESTIEVFDSLGSASPRHRRYMEGLRRYLFEDLHKDVPESQRPQYYEWSRSWALRNRSGHCPRQTNSYDCGVFTMTTIYLSSRGVAISRDTYDQHFVEAVNLRHNLALALLRVNDMADPSDSQTRLNFQSAASSQTASRKRRREHRVRVGGKRIKTQTSDRSARPQEQTDKTLNRKRSAKSLTDRDPSMRSLREMYSGHGAKRKKKWKEKTPSKVAPAGQTFAD